LTFGPTKSHAERTVPLTATLAGAIEAHLDERVGADPEALLFTSQRGYPLRYANFRREVWVPALKSAKVPKIGLHVLRHSAASAMIRAGASPRALQVILGHESAGFTLSVYGHVFDQDMAALTERLDAVLSVTDHGDGATDDSRRLPRCTSSSTRVAECACVSITRRWSSTCATCRTAKTTS